MLNWKQHIQPRTQQVLDQLNTSVAALKRISNVYAKHFPSYEDVQVPSYITDIAVPFQSIEPPHLSYTKPDSFNSKSLLTSVGLEDIVHNRYLQSISISNVDTVFGYTVNNYPIALSGSYRISTQLYSREFVRFEKEQLLESITNIVEELRETDEDYYKVIKSAIYTLNEREQFGTAHEKWHAVAQMLFRFHERVEETLKATSSYVSRHIKFRLSGHRSDRRQGFRNIIRFLFKNMDDEPGEVKANATCQLDFTHLKIFRSYGDDRCYRRA